MNFRSRFGLKPPDFQVTPMVDLIFLVLAFFLASQLFATWETELDIKLPTAQTGRLPQRLPGEIIINITREGHMTVQGRILDSAGLKQLLTRIVKLYPGQPVLIRADRATAYEHVIRVLDICRRVDIWNISFATVEASAPDRT